MQDLQRETQDGQEAPGAPRPVPSYCKCPSVRFHLELHMLWLELIETLAPTGYFS